MPLDVAKYGPIHSIRNTKENINHGEKNAIITTPDGKQYVRADREVIQGNDPKQWAKQVYQYINDEIRQGKDVVVYAADGDPLTITRDTAGKARFRNRVREKDGTLRVMTDEEYASKLRAEAHIDELGKVSTRGKRTVPDYKNHPFAKDGFNYRTAYFLDQTGEYYRVTMSVGQNGQVNTIYNVGKIEEAALPAKWAQRPGSRAAAGEETASSMNHSIQNNQKKFNLDSGKDTEKGVRYSIKTGMTDQQRYEELKDATIQAARYDADASKLTRAEVTQLEQATRRDARRYVKELYEKFGIQNRRYENQKINLEFGYGGKGLKKSISEQTIRNADYASFGKMLACFDEVVENAIPLEIHIDKYAGTRREDPGLQQVYVLISAMEDDGIVPIQLEVKEFLDKDNQLYLAVTLNKIEAGIVATTYHPKDVLSVAPPASTISLRDIFQNINPKDGELLKYIPDGFLKEEQKASKDAALEREAKKIQGYLEEGRPANGEQRMEQRYEELQARAQELRKRMEGLQAGQEIEPGLVRGMEEFLQTLKREEAVRSQRAYYPQKHSWEIQVAKLRGMIENRSKPENQGKQDGLLIKLDELQRVGRNQALSEFTPKQLKALEDVLQEMEQVVGNKTELEKQENAPMLGESGKGSLSNVEARKWYLEHEAKIPDMIDSSLPLEDQAKQAYNLRNQFRTEARELMADRVTAEYLYKTDKNLTWEELIDKQKAKGFTGDDIYREIIASAQRSRKSVNKSLGLE